MIYIDFNGRCGDQFFQYAFARNIQLHIKNNEAMSFNFFNQERWRKKLNDPSFRNNLEDFCVVPNISYVNEKTNLDRFGSKKQKKIFSRYRFVKKLSNKLKMKKLAKWYHRKMQRNGIYYDDDYFKLYSYPKHTCNIFIRGYFENYKNFYGNSVLTEHLYSELVANLKINEDNKEMLQQIKNTNSICVSLRSWKEIGDNSKVYNSRMICGKDYYFNAIDIMKKRFPDSTFFIFSDDLDWAKDILKKYEDCSFVFEKSNNSISDKILLMSSCKHFIIANSSFSWWAQYLSRNPNKTVISPDHWYNDSDDTRIINPEWIVLGTRMNDNL